MGKRHSAVTIHDSALSELRQYYAYMSNSDIVSLAVVVQNSNDPTSMAQAGLVDSLIGKTSEYQVREGDIDNVQMLMSILLDVTEGAYFTHNLTQDTKLTEMISGMTTGIEGDQTHGARAYVLISHETGLTGTPWVIGTENNAGEYVGMHRQVAPANLIAGSQYELRSGAEVGINQAAGAPSRFKEPSLSAYFFPNLRIGPQARNTDAVGLFANGIPNVELNRCVPFLNMTFYTDLPGSDVQADKNGQLGILRFLGAVDAGSAATTLDHTGLANVTPETAFESSSDTDLAAMLLSDNGIELEEVSRIGSAGMEIFTSPMTLVNADINASGYVSSHYGNKEILDPFRPLLTLQGVTISIAGQGYMAYASKIANVSMTLHDRSRMADIAPLISADRFANTHVVIEYGWSHPDGGMESDNAYGKFLNSLRCKDIFNINYANMTMNTTGEVSITLNLANRGSSMATSCPIIAGKYVPLNIAKSLLERYLANVSQKYANNNSGGSSLVEVRKKLELGVDSVGSSSGVVERSIVSDIIEAIKNGITGDNTSGITQIIENLVGEDGKGGQLAEQSQTVADEIDLKMKGILLGAAKDIDTYIISEYMDKIFDVNNLDTVTPEENANQINYVSLGRVVLSYIGYPLASCMTFDEVQVMFYGFNAQSGLARSFNVSHFPIRIRRFQKAILDMANDDLEFLSSPRTSDIIDIIKRFTDNPSDIAYGLSDLYDKFDESELDSEALSKLTEEEKKTYEESRQNLDTVLSKRSSDRLNTIYKADGLGGSPEFTLPDISFYFEEVPALDINSDGASFVKVGATILRIHVFDKSATPHINELFLLKMANDSEIAMKYNNVTAAQSTHSDVEALIESGKTPAEKERIAADNVNLDLLETAEVLAGEEYRTYINTLPSYVIKDAIKTTVPSITMGSMFNSVKNVSVNSTTSGAVQRERLITANIDREDSQEAPGAGNSIDDIFVIPASMNMTMYGMPLINYGQQFFVDLGTGTTLDNMYAITDLVHKIDQSGFETSFKCTFLGSGTTKNLRNSLIGVGPVLKELEDK